MESEPQSYSLASGREALKEHAALRERVRRSQLEHRRLLNSLPSPPVPLLQLPVLPSPTSSPSPSPSPSPPPLSQNIQSDVAKRQRSDLPPAKRARMMRYLNYVPEEETVRNDYSQRYVDGGEWPQNWVLGAEPEHRFEEYPKQQRLLALKKQSVDNASYPPCYLPLASLSNLHPSKFDVILLDPPFSSSFSWDSLSDLPIPALAADPSFIFLWVGSGAGDGLERGREILARWGYRRCEDVVWVKTNKTRNQGPGTDPPTTSLFMRTKQHCLMGIRGTVRRSTDSWFVHCNIDTDVIIWEGDRNDPTRKPPEMYTLIENFCLGTRRLEIFGRDHSLRRGWVTVGDLKLNPAVLESTSARPWDREIWEGEVKREAGKNLVASTSEIDALRPKSPVRLDRNVGAGPARPLNMNGVQQPGGFSPSAVMGLPMQPAFGMMPMGIPMGMAPHPHAGFSFNHDGSMTYGRGVGVGGNGPMWMYPGPEAAMSNFGPPMGVMPGMMNPQAAAALMQQQNMQQQSMNPGFPWPGAGWFPQ